VLLSGCVRQARVSNATARLYNVSSGEVISGVFTYDSSGRGRVTVDFSDGERATGEYVTVAGGTTSWGTIFAYVYGTGGFATGRVLTRSVQNEQYGTAIATGNRGRVIQCEYISSAVVVQGYGACRDNRDVIYRLVF
jgi:hypothetical protein